MRDFKFACPVCGQHITADAAASGGQLSCPTCFRKIVVPQAPASEDTKLILSAAHAPEVPQTSVEAAVRRQKHPSQNLFSLLSASALLLLTAMVVLGLFAFRDRLFRNRRATAEAEAPQVQPSQSDSGWVPSLADAAIPEAPVSGSLHGTNFTCQQATLQGGRLTLAQGNTWPPELGLTIFFYVQESEKLFGKSLEVAPDRAPPLPRVVLRWRNEQLQAVTRTIHSGYALRLSFGKPAQGRLPGRLYIALPDPERSVLAGTFDAEIRKAARPPEPESTNGPAKPLQIPDPVAAGSTNR